MKGLKKYISTAKIISVTILIVTAGSTLIITFHSSQGQVSVLPKEKRKNERRNGTVYTGILDDVLANLAPRVFFLPIPEGAREIKDPGNEVAFSPD